MPDGYRVSRIDGSAKHRECDFFVLDLTHDAAARSAVLLYAKIREKKQPEIAKNIRIKVSKYRNNLKIVEGDE